MNRFILATSSAPVTSSAPAASLRFVARTALILAFVFACFGGCADDRVQQPVMPQQNQRPGPPDLELLVIDGGTSHPVTFRLPSVTLAVFQDGTIIRSTAFPRSAATFQTLHVEASVVSALRERFQRLESACRGKQFIGPDMSDLRISGRNDAEPAEWVRLVFPMYATVDKGKSVIDPQEFLMLREIVDLIKDLDWSASTEASPQDLKRIENLK